MSECVGLSSFLLFVCILYCIFLFSPSLPYTLTQQTKTASLKQWILKLQQAVSQGSDLQVKRTKHLMDFISAIKNNKLKAQNSLREVTQPLHAWVNLYTSKSKVGVSVYEYAELSDGGVCVWEHRYRYTQTSHSYTITHSLV
jgi:hypothetical protein